MPIQHVLVPIDFSDYADQAWPTPSASPAPSMHS